MILPQLPHSSRTEETHDSFSTGESPASTALAWFSGSSSQKTQRRHRGGRSSRLSRVMLARRRDTWHSCGRDSGRTDVLPGARPSPWRAWPAPAVTGHRLMPPRVPTTAAAPAGGHPAAPAGGRGQPPVIVKLGGWLLPARASVVTTTLARTTPLCG